MWTKLFLVNYSTENKYNSYVIRAENQIEQTNYWQNVPSAKIIFYLVRRQVKYDVVGRATDHKESGH